MRRGRASIALLHALAFAASAAAGPAQSGPGSASGAAAEDIIVRAYPPKCHPRPGDPIDAVDLSAAKAAPVQQVIRRDPATGRLGLFRDDYPETEEVEWQRDGTRLDQFVFRVPDDGMPLCVGSRGDFGGGLAQLRRAFVARPYRGRIVRFTAFVATRRVRDVRLWLAAGAGKYRVDLRVNLGSNVVVAAVSPTPLRGNHGWTPVMLSIGPVPCQAEQISYGITLDGHGDAWLYRPEFSVVADEGAASKGKNGEAYTGAPSACRRP